MVAVLVPPTLTFLGFVGDSQAQRLELSWSGAEQAKTSTHSSSTTPAPQSEELQCWSETSF